MMLKHIEKVNVQGGSFLTPFVLWMFLWQAYTKSHEFKPCQAAQPSLVVTKWIQDRMVAVLP